MVSNDTWHTEFAYDGLSRRIESREYTNGSLSSVKRHVYDGWLPVAELNETNGLVHTMTWGLDLSMSFEGAGRALHRTEGSGAGGIGGLLSLTRHSTPDTRFFFYDGNGNVTDVLDDSDTLAAHYEYDPFGNRLVADGPYADQPFQWSTKMHHEASRLVYYGYRFLKPDIGRWLNRDPIEEKGGMHLYAYSANDSLNRYDALGLTGMMPGGRRYLGCCGGSPMYSTGYYSPRCCGNCERGSPYNPNTECCLNAAAARVGRQRPVYACYYSSKDDCMAECRDAVNDQGVDDDIYLAGPRIRIPVPDHIWPDPSHTWPLDVIICEGVCNFKVCCASD